MFVGIAEQQLIQTGLHGQDASAGRRFRNDLPLLTPCLLFLGCLQILALQFIPTDLCLFQLKIDIL